MVNKVLTKTLPMLNRCLIGSSYYSAIQIIFLQDFALSYKKKESWYNKASGNAG